MSTLTRRPPRLPGSRPGYDRRMLTWTAVATIAVILSSGFSGYALLQTKASQDQANDVQAQANKVQAKANATQQATQNAELEAAMGQLDQAFLDHPKVYPFFYIDMQSPRGTRGLMPPKTGMLRHQAFSMAERVIDFADQIAAYMRTNTMVARDAKRWAQLMRSYFAESPTLRLAWKHYSEPYGRVTACLLGAPDSPRASWDWRRGRPKATWPKDCSGVS